jgi:hypothetical protein
MQRVDLPLDDLPAALPPWGHGRMRAWWHTFPEAPRAPLWPRSFALLLILALVLSFHQVVRDAVRQGEVLRMTAATRAEAIWRCNSLSGARKRATCLAQVDAPPKPQANSGRPPPNTAGVSIADVGR